MISIEKPASIFSSLFKGTNTRAKSMRATVLVTGGFGLSKVMQLGSNLILTRLLFPEAFGLMALVTVFVGGLKMVSDVGVSPSIIRSERGEDPTFLSTAWTLMVFRGVAITGLAWLLAWPYAQIYDQDILFPLICISALSAVATGFKSIEVSVRSRNVDLGRVTCLELVGQAISITVTVLLAWSTQSVWGLAIGNVLGASLSSLLSHFILPSQHNRFKWDRSVLSEIVNFGRWILIGTLFTYFSREGIKAISGVLVSIETLAFIHIAMLFGWAFGELATRVIGSVAFPAMSKTYREKPEDLERVTRKIRNLQLLCTTPLFIGLSIISYPFIDFLYDSRYAVAGTFLSVLALNGAISTSVLVYQRCVLTLGHSRLHAVVMGLSGGSKIIGTVVGYYIAGPVGMVVAWGGGDLIAFTVSFVYANRFGLATWRTDMINLSAIFVIYMYTLLSIDWSL